MQIYKTIEEYRDARKGWIRETFASKGREPTIGFVPTMGALHEGHLSLCRKALEENDFVVTSIFLNPKQFSENEDLSTYPRTFESDLKLLQSIGSMHVFAPSTALMYPPPVPNITPEYGTFISIEGINEVSEGAARPGFFRGVATVVAKLFNIIQPTSSYFGQKDGLQCIVIKQLVRDLNFDIKIVILPTSREKDGLAMSSRNVYLNEEERKIAPILYQSFLALQDKFKEGERRVSMLRKVAVDILEANSAITIQYLSIANNDTADEYFGTLSEEACKKGIFVSGAILLRKTRLIDNIVLIL